MTRAIDRGVCGVDARARRRTARAMTTNTGVIESATNASVTLREKSTAVMPITSRIWLSRFIVSVTTFEKSSESEVTRLTILPDGLVS